MAFAPSLFRTVLFGGRSSPSVLRRDTWLWDGAAWSRPRTDSEPPPDQQNNGMAYWESPSQPGQPVEVRPYVLVLANALAVPGSAVQADVGLLDTWTWDGKTKGPVSLPEPRVPDTRSKLTLELSDPDAPLPADGKSTKTLTAKLTFGGQPAGNRPISFATSGDLSLEPSNCTTDAEGTCSVVVIASLSPGAEGVTADAKTASAHITVFETRVHECSPEEPVPPRGPEEWWGNLDSNFGCHGRGFPGPFDEAIDMAIQPDDGKIVVLAKDKSGPEWITYLMRYNTDGTLDGGPGDTTPEDGEFGSGGFMRAAGEYLVIQQDGKIVTGGGSNLFRHNADGTLDGGPGDSMPEDGDFGNGGIAALGDVGNTYALALQPGDGKILAATRKNPVSFGTATPATIVRVNSDGTPDNGVPGEDRDPRDSFGDASRVDFFFRDDHVLNTVKSVVIQQDNGHNKILLGGVWESGSGIVPVTSRWGLARLLPNGDLDTSFNREPCADVDCNGKSSPVMDSNYEGVTDLAIQDDKIVALGTTSEGGNRNRFQLARFDGDGKLDPEFNPCGTSPPPCGGKLSARGEGDGNTGGFSVAIEKGSGKIVVAGASVQAQKPGYLVARLNRDGAPDESCGLPWRTRITFAGSSNAYAVATQDHGGREKIVVAGRGTILRLEGGSVAPAPSEITVHGATINEPKAGQTDAPFNIKLKLDAPACHTLSYDYATSNGTATAGQDYTETKGAVVFQKGEQERIVPVPVLPDNHPEPPETFNMSVSNSVSLADPTRPKELRLPVVKQAEGEAKILDPQPDGKKTDPALTGPSLSIGDTSVMETNQASTATFPVALNAPSNKKVTVDYRTHNDTAQAPGDYSATTGTVTFEPGQTQKTVTVDIAGDVVPEPTESFYVELKDPNGATLLRPKATATVYDDDSGGAQPSAIPRATSTVPTAAGLLVPGANFPPPSLAQGTQIQAQQQIQQQLQQQAQAQLMAGVMSERQKQIEIEKAGLQGKDAYLATARRQSSPVPAWAFAWVGALAAFATALVYSRQTSSEPATNKLQRRKRRTSGDRERA